jgi:predicted dehydrogenase
MPGPGEPVGVAVVGCGTISNEYLRNLTSFADLRVLACADIEVERARAQAAKYGVPGAGSTAEAIGHPGVELVVNLTVPAAHAEVTAAAVSAGRSVWTEKPLATDTTTGRRLVRLAKRHGVRIGCAPDTLLGAGLQSARRLIEAGAIGVPQTALALLQTPGPESWHPDPAFLFQRGAGPLFDMGPYYLSALAALFGPARQVAALGRRSRDSRVIATGPRAGTAFPVEVPTHVAALIDYAAGQAATLLLSFDSPLHRHGFVEITGTEATLALPDPNGFGGDVRIRTADASDWTATPATGAAHGRGLGVLDLAQAIRAGTPHRATGDMGLHVLETMEAIGTSAAEGRFEPVHSTFQLPPAVPEGWDPELSTVASTAT